MKSRAATASGCAGDGGATSSLARVDRFGSHSVTMSTGPSRRLRHVLASLAARLSAGGLPSETTPDMRGVLWAKMLYNCALNPLGALAGRRYGELVEDPTTRRLVDEVIHEIFAVLSEMRTVL